MTELGHNTPLGRGGLSLLTVVIILTRPVRPANVSRTDGRGWAVVVAGGQFLRVFIIAPRRNRGRKDRRNHTD